jgi:hypothetical protein
MHYSWLTRIALLLRDLSVSCSVFPELNEFIKHFQRFFLDGYTMVETALQDSIFHVLYELICSSSLSLTASPAFSFSKMKVLYKKVLHLKNFDIFLSESSVTVPADLVITSIYFLMKVSELPLDEASQWNSFKDDDVIQCFLLIGDFLPELLTRKTSSNNGASDDVFRQISTLSKGLFDCVNCILFFFRENDDVETSSYFRVTTNFQFLCGIFSLVYSIYPFFKSKGLHYLPAFLQRFGSIISSYFQKNYISSSYSTVFSLYAERFLEVFNNFTFDLLKELESMSSSFHSETAYREIVESVVSLNILFLTKSHFFLQGKNLQTVITVEESKDEAPDILQENKKKEVNYLLTILKSFRFSLLLYLKYYYHDDEIDSSPVKDSILLSSSSSSLSTKTSIPIFIEKSQKMMICMMTVILNGAELISPSPQNRKRSEKEEEGQLTESAILEEFSALLNSHLFIRNYLLCYFIKERKSKFSYFLKENRFSSMELYTTFLSMLILPSSSHYDDNSAGQKNEGEENIIEYCKKIISLESQLIGDDIKILLNMKLFKQDFNQSDVEASSPCNSSMEKEKCFIELFERNPVIEAYLTSIKKTGGTSYVFMIYFLYYKIKVRLLFSQFKEQRVPSDSLSKEEKSEIMVMFDDWKQLIDLLSHKPSFRENDHFRAWSHVIISLDHSMELPCYFSFLQLLGKHNLQHGLYQMLSCHNLFSLTREQESSSSSSLSFFRIQLCVNYYWNYFPASSFNEDAIDCRQLAKTKSNQELFKSTKEKSNPNSLLFFDSKELKKKSLFACGSSSQNVFLSLEDYFYSCHHFLLMKRQSPISSSSLPEKTETLKKGKEREDYCDEDGVSQEVMLDLRISLVKHCNYLISLLSHSPSSSVYDLSTKQRFDFIAVISWIYLFHARILFFQFGEVRESLSFCRLALAGCSLPSSSTTDSRLLPPNWIVPKFEILILLSEIYEFMGKSNRCIDYLSESLSLTTSTYDWKYLVSIYALHAFRIFLRLNSSRLFPLLEHTISLFEENRDGDDTSSFSLSHENLTLVQSSFDMILRLFPGILRLVKEQSKQISSTNANMIDRLSQYLQPSSLKSTEEEIGPLLFRFSYRFYGFSNDTKKEMKFRNNKDIVFDAVFWTLNSGSFNENRILKCHLNSSNRKGELCSSVYARLIIDNFSIFHDYKKYNFQLLKQLRKDLCYFSASLPSSISQSSSSSSLSSPSSSSSSSFDGTGKNSLINDNFSSFLVGLSSIMISMESSTLSLTSFVPPFVSSMSTNSFDLSDAKYYL